MAADRSGQDEVKGEAVSLSLRERVTRLRRAFYEVFYGFTTHELYLETKRERNQADRLFMLIVFGDLIGIPILPPYYSMRLLPHVVPHIQGWRRSVLRERDLLDKMGKDG